MHRRMTRTASVIVVAGLLVAACGDDDPETDAPEPATTETVTEEETPDEADGTGDSGDDGAGQDQGVTEDENGDAAAGGSEGTDPVPDEELPGEEFSSYFSDQGQAADVVGVEADDVLFVRALPDPDAEEVGRIAPTGQVTLAGRERDVEHGMWTEVELDNGVGWVNTAYLGYIPDQAEDVTDEVTEQVSDISPHADSTELVLELGEQRTLSHGDAGPDTILVETPADSEVYRMDVVGLPDDSILGERLELHVQSTEAGYEIIEAQSFPICRRGAGDEGLCT